MSVNSTLDASSDAETIVRHLKATKSSTMSGYNRAMTSDVLKMHEAAKSTRSRLLAKLAAKKIKS